MVRAQAVAALDLRQMTDPTETDPTVRARRWLALPLLLVAVLGAVDLVTDSPRQARPVHVAIEIAFIGLGALSAALLWRGWRASERSLADVRRSLAAHASERDLWRARAETAIRGLGEAMDAQFAAWSLTPAEKETALLLLKGYSHKEVAALTSRSERTVRQHAIAVYRKSGLSGRAELAAFFFEDLLLPSSLPTPAGPPAD